MEEIKIGSTTRKEIIEILGEPEILDDRRFCVYELYSSKGKLVWLVAGSNVGFFPSTPLDEKNYRVLLEFDSNSVLNRLEIERGHALPFQGDGFGGIVAESLPQLLTNQPKPEIILKGSKPGIFGDFIIDDFGSLAFSPDGRLIAAGIGGATIGKPVVVIWDADSGSQKMILKGERGAVFSRGLHWGIAPVVFSPDGKFVMAAGGILPTIWKLPSGKKKFIFEEHGYAGFWGHRKEVYAMSFSPNGQEVASGAADGSIKLWEANGGRVLKTFDEETWVNSIAFSPNGKLLAASSKNIIIWDLVTGKELERIKPGRWGDSIAFSPDGKLLALSRISHIEIWSVYPMHLTGEAINNESDKAERVEGYCHLVSVFLNPYVGSALRGHTKIVFSPDGKKIAASYGGAAIWNLSDRQPLFRYSPAVTAGRKRDLADDVAFSPDAKKVALATGYGVFIFNLPIESVAVDSEMSVSP